MAFVRLLIALVVVLVVGPRVASADEVPTSCGDARELLKGQERTAIEPAWMASPAPSAAHDDEPFVPADLCLTGGLDGDCRLQDPSFPPCPGGQQELTRASNAVTSEAPALPDPDVVRRPHARTDAGEALPGFVRGLFRPPRA